MTLLEYDDEGSGGFASCEIGNKLTEEQWAKLKLVKDVAEEVWWKNVILMRRTRK